MEAGQAPGGAATASLQARHGRSAVSTDLGEIFVVHRQSRIAHAGRLTAPARGAQSDVRHFDLWTGKTMYLRQAC